MGSSFSLNSQRQDSPTTSVNIIIFSYRLIKYIFLKWHVIDIKNRIIIILYGLVHTEHYVKGILITTYNKIALRVTSTPPEHLVGREIRRIKWGVYAHSDYINKFGKPGSLTELDNYRLIGATGVLRSHPAFIWQEKHLANSIGSRTDDLVAMACLANNAHGLAILPDDLKQPGLMRLFTFEPAKENQLWILTHPDLRKVERIKLVMAFLTDAFGKE